MNVCGLIGFGLAVFVIADLSYQPPKEAGVRSTVSGNSNSGHDYGTKLSDNDKHDLIEYLKTL